MKLHHLYILNLIILIYIRENDDRGARCVHEGLQTRKESGGRYIVRKKHGLGGDGKPYAFQAVFENCAKI